jgi:hypothetical protein
MTRLPNSVAGIIGNKAPKLPVARLGVLAATMLTSGTVITMACKWQDKQCVAECDAADPCLANHYEQPLWQSLNFTLGSMLCLPIYFYVRKRRNHRQSSGMASVDQPKSLDIPLDLASHSNTCIDDIKDGGFEEQDGVEIVDDLPSIPLQGWAWLMPAIPALMDVTSSVMVNMGLIMLSASIYQMLRGSVYVDFSLIFVLQNRR